MSYSASYILKFIKYNNPIQLGIDYIIKKKFYGEKFKYQNSFITDQIEVLRIIVVAFNNSMFIQLQHETLMKYLDDKFEYIVMDNSTNMEESELIKSYCNEKAISYFKLPNNPLRSSKGHGIALNYIMKNFIYENSIKYFGFIDHDCFMIGHIKIIPILRKQQIYGSIEDNTPFHLFGKSINMAGDRWFLWPGCSFFDVQVFEKGYNFELTKSIFPLSFLDTGGGNYKYVYQFFDKSKLQLHRQIKGYIGSIFFHVSGGGSIKNQSDRDRLHNGLKIVQDGLSDNC